MLCIESIGSYFLYAFSACSQVLLHVCIALPAGLLRNIATMSAS